MAFGLTLTSCASYRPSSAEIEAATSVTMQSLVDQPEAYDGKLILVEGCLDFHGIDHKAFLNFDLTGRPPIVRDDYVYSLFVDGKYIPRKYRTSDKVKVTQTGETTFTHETIDERDFYVRLVGGFSNQKAPLNTGGHLVFSDHFDGRIDNAKIVEVLEVGCKAVVPHPIQ